MVFRGLNPRVPKHQVWMHLQIVYQSSFGKSQLVVWMHLQIVYQSGFGKSQLVVALGQEQ